MNIMVNRSLPIVSWSLGNQYPDTHGEDYFIYFASGNLNTSYLPFWIEVEGNIPIELGVASHHLEAMTDDLEELISTFPKWVDPVCWVSFWKGFKL